ncbi:hypothetical protein RYD26_04005 [Pasteurellaceae bacterium LIM206]|nr:hypothetical protein [Pasteurellaceae bacterium LIM206]
MSELSRLLNESPIPFEAYAYIHLLQATARRSIQIRHLKFEDLKKEMSKGAYNYYLNIPTAKKSGLFRETFKKLAIIEDLYLALLSFI